MGDDKGLKYWPHPNTQSAPRVLFDKGPKNSKKESVERKFYRQDRYQKDLGCPGVFRWWLDTDSSKLEIIKMDENEPKMNCHSSSVVNVKCV